MNVEKMEEGDAKAVIEIAATVLVSMTYARFASLSIASGKLRLVSLLPVISLLPFVPFRLSSLHLRSAASFFLVWLATFKLVFLSFGLGPLSPSLPLPAFLAVSSLPVNLVSPNSPPLTSITRLFLLSVTKFIFLYFLIHLYEHELHPYFLMPVYCVHIYLALEIALSCSALLVRVLLRLDVEPHFDAPYKSTSLQEFWGRRWNLMVTDMLRTLVYNPVSALYGPDAGMMAAFILSGIIHEVMFWYATRAKPTGEVTGFFLVNGVCTVLEGVGRRKGWWKPHPMLAVPIAVGFVMVTGYWLFLPPLLRTGTDRVVQAECIEAMRFMRRAAGVSLSRIAIVLGWQ